MKFYELTGDICNFFVDEMIVKNIDFSNSTELEKFLKKNILSIKNRFNVILNGLYYVDIYINNKVGAFIYMSKEDSFIRTKEIDMRIKIIYDNSFFYKTSLYEILKNEKDVYFYNGYYYINASNLSDITKYLEFGEIIHDNDLNLENIGKKIL